MEESSLILAEAVIRLGIHDKKNWQWAAQYVHDGYH
jgi:hypothetical protein